MENTRSPRPSGDVRGGGGGTLTEGEIRIMVGFDKADVYYLTWDWILSSIEQSVSRLLSNMLCVCVRAHAQINIRISMNYSHDLYLFNSTSFLCCHIKVNAD